MNAVLVRRARQLAWLSVIWMLFEGTAATTAAVLAGSVALLGFGLDSLIELGSASVVIWRFSDHQADSARAERAAQRMLAFSFVALALYLTIDAVHAIAAGSREDVGWMGWAISTGAMVIMPLLARAKIRVGRRLGSAAIAGDAAQSWLCALTAAGVLASIAANAMLGWWWLDPVVGFVIAALAAKEGREAWEGAVQRQGTAV